MTKKKMVLKLGLTDPENVVGFAQVKNFDGVTMRINPKYLKEALSALTAFDKARDEVQIGITDKLTGGAFFLFLDNEHEMAIAAKGRVEK